MTFTYSAPQADPAGLDFLVGAENSNGEGQMNATLPSADLVVTSSAPVPGGKAEYTVWVKGTGAGTGVATSQMTSALVPGTTVTTSEIEVLPR